MFIRVVLLININSNNSYITALQELSVCVFIETISVSVKIHSTLRPLTLKGPSIFTVFQVGVDFKLLICM